MGLPGRDSGPSKKKPSKKRVVGISPGARANPINVKQRPNEKNSPNARNARIANSVGATAGAYQNNITQFILKGQKGKFTDPVKAGQSKAKTTKDPTAGYSQMDSARLAEQQKQSKVAKPKLTSVKKAKPKTTAAGGDGYGVGGSYYDSLGGGSGGGSSGGSGGSGGGSSAPITAKSLKDYIKQANADLGKGTDYSALQKQLKSDTGRSDKNIANMYSALQSGIRAQDPTLKAIYTDAQGSTNTAGSQAQSTINAAYDSARSNTAARLKAVGAPAGAGAISGGFADADQANAVSRSASGQQSAVQQLISQESTARTANSQRANTAGFTGAQTRSDLAQQLADNLSRVKVQQTQADADRRKDSLTLAQQMQSRDDSIASSSAQAAQDAYYKDREYNLSVAKAREQEGVDNASAATAARRADQADQAESDKQAVAVAKAKADAASSAESKRKTRANLYATLLKAHTPYNGTPDTAAAKRDLKALGY